MVLRSKITHDAAEVRGGLGSTRKGTHIHANIHTGRQTDREI